MYILGMCIYKCIHVDICMHVHVHHMYHLVSVDFVRMRMYLMYICVCIFKCVYLCTYVHAHAYGCLMYAHICVIHMSMYAGLYR
jgi:hypothetical protein